MEWIQHSQKKLHLQGMLCFPLVLLSIGLLSESIVMVLLMLAALFDHTLGSVRGGYSSGVVRRHC